MVLASNREITADALIFGNGVDVSQVPLEIEGIVEGRYGRYVNQLTGEVYPLIVTAADIDAGIAQFKARKERNPERDLVIDYEHQTFLTDGQAPAAGWIEDVYAKVRDGKKVMMLKLKAWTKKADEYLKNKEYRFFSPVFAQNAIDKETGKLERFIFKGGALTNEPFFDGILPIISSHKHPHKESTMNKVIARLREIFQLAADAQEDTILAKLNEYVQTATNSLKEVVSGLGLKNEFTLDDLKGSTVMAKGAIGLRSELITALGLEANASNEAIKAAVVTAKSGAGELPNLAAKVLTLENADFDRRFDSIIAKAFQEGKIMPVTKNDDKWIASQKSFAKANITEFESFWAKQPVIAPVKKIPAGGSESPEDKGDPVVIAKEAQDYQRKEAEAGRHISVTEAVNHVTKKGAR